MSDQPPGMHPCPSLSWEPQGRTEETTSQGSAELSMSCEVGLRGEETWFACEVGGEM